MFIVKSRKEVLWSLLFISAGLLAGAALTISPLLKTFIQNVDKGKIVVVIDAGHQDLAYALN